MTNADIYILGGKNFLSYSIDGLESAQKALGWDQLPELERVRIRKILADLKGSREALC